ncbi:MAG: proton-translocating NADH-quinone oxidoreductase, chain, partial [Myxococcales bacterium]|nr:proton-translocating NADH-quinone oxidoreductase, chain [Myxococcales bacterium]
MLLTTVTFLPLFGAILCLLLPRQEEGLLRGFAFTVSLATFGVSLFILGGEFQPAQWNHVVDKEWVGAFGVHFKLGVDGISLWLVLLTTFLMPIVFAASWTSINKKVREFVVAMLILETGMIGTFLAIDLFVFYVFWEVMLIPMYFIIGIWGGDRKLYAAIKFVIYTMVGSLLMIVAILYLYVRQHDATGIWTFDYDQLMKVVLSPTEQLYCFLAFALAFCIKVPLFPFHTWLPDAHVEAPTAGSVVLASVMLKFGTYGLLRYAIPFFPDAFVRMAPLLNTLAVIGIVYGSLVAFAQKDVKKLIAYSSVAHLGFVVLGLGMWNVKSVDGAMMINLAHGISTGGLFLCIGVVYERRHTRKLDEFGGLATIMPRYFGVFMVMTLASVGLPGTSGFVGEFLALIGSFDAYKHWTQLAPLFPHPKLLTGVATLGVILSAVYMLYLFQKMMFGPLSNPRNRDLKDLTWRECAYFAPMIVAALWLGIYPNTFLADIDPAVQKVVSALPAKYQLRVSDGDVPRILGAQAPQPTDGAAAQPGTAQPP